MNTQNSVTKLDHQGQVSGSSALVSDTFAMSPQWFSLEEDRLLTAKDLQYIFSIGKNRAYELMNSKAFPTLQIGGRKYVSRGALRKWVEMYSGREYFV